MSSKFGPESEKSCQPGGVGDRGWWAVLRMEGNNDKEMIKNNIELLFGNISYTVTFMESTC